VSPSKFNADCLILYGIYTLQHIVERLLKLLMCKVLVSWERKVLESCWGSDPGSNLGKLSESGGNQGEVPVSGLSGEFGSTCVVEGPNTWEATDGHGPGDVRVGWRMRIEGLVT